MTGFFETLAARAVGVSPGLRPRVAQRFEPPTRGGGRGRAGAGGSPWDASQSDDAGGGQGSGPHVEQGLGEGLELDSLVESAPPGFRERTGPGRGTSRPPARETDESVLDPPLPRPGSPREAASDSRAEPGAEFGTAARAEAGRALRTLARDAIAPATQEPDRQSASPAPRGDRSARTGASADDSPRDRSDQRDPDQPAPSPGTAGDRPERAGGDAEPARDQTRALPVAALRLRRQARPTSRPAPGSAPGPNVDLAALLREEVFAALLDRGAVPRRERPVVVPPGKRASPPRLGTATIRAEGVSSAGRAQPRSAGDWGSVDTGPPSVHVHIDRVSVQRAAPPASTQPPQPRPSVDHAAYLARRRERG